MEFKKYNPKHNTQFNKSSISMKRRVIMDAYVLHSVSFYHLTERTERLRYGLNYNLHPHHNRRQTDKYCLKLMIIKIFAVDRRFNVSCCQLP